MFGSKIKLFLILAVLGIASARSFISYIERPGKYYTISSMLEFFKLKNITDLDFTGKPITITFDTKHNQENTETEQIHDEAPSEKNSTDLENSEDDKSNEIDTSDKWSSNDKSYWLREKSVATTESSVPTDETICGGGCSDNTNTLHYRDEAMMNAISKL